MERRGTGLVWVLMLLAAGACGSSVDSEAPSTNANGGQQEPSSGQSLTCEDPAGDLSAGDGSGIDDLDWIDITSVVVADTGEAFEVAWDLAGEVPERAESSGTVVTNLWAVRLLPASAPGYWLKLEQAGDRWTVEVLDESMEGDIEVDTPLDARVGSTGLSAVFPTRLLERVGPETAWFALSVGDAIDDDSADPGTVSDRCPDGESPLQLEPNLPLR